MSLRRFAACLLLSTAVWGCGDDGGDGDGDGGGGGGTAGGEVSPAQVCEDVADAVAEAAMRCGQDYQANYDAFIEVAAGGDCGNIVSIRDTDEVYDGCIPSMETIACEELVAGNIDDTCLAQLERPAGLTCEASSPMTACVEIDDLATGV